MRKPSDRNRGMILLAVLWMSVLLAVIVSGLQRSAGIEVTLTTTAALSQQARFAALAGIEMSKAVLASDGLGADSFEDDWAAQEDLWSAVEVGDAGVDLIRDDLSDDADVHFGLTDESAKINVNTATKEMLAKVPGITPDLAEAIIKRREDSEAGGPLRTLREMLLFEGMTPEIFFGEDANGNGVLDESENDRDDNPPPDNGNAVLDRGLVSCLTVWSLEQNVGPNGLARTNIQTASAHELQLNVPELTEQEANAIVSYRGENKFESVAALLDVTEQKEGGGSSDQKIFSVERFAKICDYVTVSEDDAEAGKVNLNTVDEVLLAALPGFSDELADTVAAYRLEKGSFSSLGDLFKVSGFNADVYRQAEKFITVRSASFSVHAVAWAGQPRVHAVIDAVIHRHASEPQIVYYLERSL